MSLNVIDTSYGGASISYVEIDTSIYDIKLVSQPDGGPKKSVLSLMSEVENSEAAINGQLMNGSGYVGGCRDRFGLIRGTFTGYMPSMKYENSVLSEEWVYNNASIPSGDFVMNCAYYCFLRNGSPVTDYYYNSDNPSEYPYGKNNYEAEKTRSFIGQKTNGTIIFATTTSGSLTADEQASFLFDLGYDIGINLDGGSSRKLVCKTSTGTIEKGETNPQVLNALVAVRKTGSSLKMKFTGSIGYIRDNVVNGSPLTFIPNGASVPVINLYGWTASDGYRWGWGEYNNISGYFQYDPAVMHPEGIVPNENYHMVLTGSSAAIRCAVMGDVNTLQTVVLSGQNIRILEFIPHLCSDGYYWCRGKWLTYEGYFQYNPAVLYPTDDYVYMPY